MKTSRFQAVLFDLDGTLLDTLEDLAAATNAVLQAHGLPGHETAAYRYFVGSGARKLLASALPADSVSAFNLEELVVEFESTYKRLWPEHTRPYPGVRELLTGLKELGIPISVLSNKPDDFTRRIAAELMPWMPFRFVYGARPGAALKPDPTSCLEIAHLCRVTPDAFLYAGDSGIDMQTACRAGMFPVGVLWGFREAAELLENGAARLVEQPAQILDFILDKESL